MSEIKFGAMYSRLHPVISAPDFARRIEDLGFDSLWSTEAPVNEMPSLDIMMTTDAFVHHTQKITVGTCVVLVPLRNPAILAKEVATLDHFSEGRLVFGIGVGGSSNSSPASFDVAGVNVKERGARTDESLEVMTKLWSGAPVSHHGQFYNFNDVVMEPRPVQEPYPPIWAGGTAEGVLKRTARWCHGFVPTNPSPEGYRQLWNRIEGYCDESGRDPSEITKAMVLMTCLAGSRNEATGIAHKALTQRYGVPQSLPTDGRHAFGIVQDCIETIERFIEVGVTHFIFNTCCPLSEVMGQLEQVAGEVAPYFR